MPLKAAQLPDFTGSSTRSRPLKLSHTRRRSWAPCKSHCRNSGLAVSPRRRPAACCLLVLAPANLPRGSAYELFKGVIETPRWFGPLITNMR
jgi:hypothetical protein